MREDGGIYISKQGQMVFRVVSEFLGGKLNRKGAARALLSWGRLHDGEKKERRKEQNIFEFFLVFLLTVFKAAPTALYLRQNSFSSKKNSRGKITCCGTTKRITRHRR